LEEEIEKLNGSKGLRNKEETLKLARLMVRADDPTTRHQLLDIIIKTEEQACLRLFLDYHGLPLMWCWMADNVDLDLKAKILQVLALLPISNKTMLRDSKVMSVVEKWLQECSGSRSNVSAISSDSSALNPATEENSEPLSKKLKVDFSDCETDSSGSQKVDDNPSENTPSIIENVVSPDGETQSEPSKENNSTDVQQIECTVSEDDQSSGLKMNISNMATELLSNWKNLKELFRIPRLEQQKRREDELEADHKVIPELPPEIKIPMAEPAGDQIQVVISGKICNFSENVKSFDYQDSNMKTEDNPRKTGRSNPLLPSPKLPNRHFTKRGVDKAGPRKLREDSPSGSATPLFPANIPLPGAQVSTRPPLLPSPNIFEPSPFNFPPPVNPPATPLQHLDPAPQVMFSPQMVYPQPQVSI
ncbi:histone-lysine N-methyltransferase SETD2-like, partial [Stegodyphus dumicola]|uniref:histone-lysine N-methyltransferase SETD2-like n=1 Tax=Stegodyphus dumicola TaxID=202533 RepID=UPI0015B1036B